MPTQQNAGKWDLVKMAKKTVKKVTNAAKKMMGHKPAAKKATKPKSKK